LAICPTDTSWGTHGSSTPEKADEAAGRTVPFALLFGCRIAQVFAGLPSKVLEALDDIRILVRDVAIFADVVFEVIQGQADLALAIRCRFAVPSAWSAGEGDIAMREVQFPLAAAKGLEFAAPVKVVGSKQTSRKNRKFRFIYL
jgi:hypothetical protein